MLRSLVLVVAGVVMVATVAAPAAMADSPGPSQPVPILTKQWVPPDPSATVTTIKHTPEPNTFGPPSLPLAPSVPTQYSCIVGSQSYGGYLAEKFVSGLNAATGYVPYVRDLYPCTGSLGFIPSETLVDGANIQGGTGQIIQTGYGKKDGGSIGFWFTSSDHCGGCYTSWPDSGFNPRVGDYVRFMITPSGSYWKIDVYDVTLGTEEYTLVGKSWSSGFAWWGFETDNTSTVLDVPVNYPEIWIYDWLYSTNGGSSWTNAGALTGLQLNSGDSAFYHGAVGTQSGVHGLYAWTTAH